MILTVAKEGKIYYIKEFTGTGITIKKNKENKFLLYLDDRAEPIATYSTWEKANTAMDLITQTYAKRESIVIIEPN